MSRSLQFLARQFPVILILWGFGLAAFLGGYLVSEFRWFPDSSLDRARLAVGVLRATLDSGRIYGFRGWTEIPFAEAPNQRMISHVAASDTAYLVTGGPWEFMEYCPENGCAAVILGRDGRLIHAYPFRPAELLENRLVDLPYDDLFHDLAKDAGIIGLAPLPGGDLIVVYDLENSSPFGGGVARMNTEGHIIWYRRDYSSHWPRVINRNEILIIGHTIGPARVPVMSGETELSVLDCEGGGILTDSIRVLDENGQVKEEILLLGAMLGSVYSGSLVATKDVCDPLHTNSVNPIGAELAARLSNVRPEDLLVSFRNIDALAIIGRSDHRVKYLFKGSFYAQHSAQIGPGGDIVLFDNWGGSRERGPSRVLQYDPVTGQERTIFPNRNTPADLPTYSSIKGNIELSKDRTSALVTFWQVGRAYEIRLSDGELLTTFDNLHDMHAIPSPGQAAEVAVRVGPNGVYYVDPELLVVFGPVSPP